MFNYLSTKEDEREWVEAIRVARNILKQKLWTHLMVAKFHQDHKFKRMKKFRLYVKMEKLHYIHLVARKWDPASDPMAVVDPLTMKVHGMENLRVVDASAMPRTTNGNIHAPVLMLAEKAADIIRGRKPLEPQYVDYYKHGIDDEKQVQWKMIHSTNIKIV